ncbi:MAG: hypothetical protein IT236_14850 [Bacteroidia bacterium]|nr:hypothetical protein [Bacteroidia bacterium]
MLAKNLVSVLIPTILAILVSQGLIVFAKLNSNFWAASIIYHSLFCFVLNLIYVAKKNSEDFTGLLMTGVAIKLLLAFFIIFLFSFFSHTTFFAFSVHFVLHYILFTIFEIRYLLYLINYNKNHEKNIRP